ncbi:PIN domain-containing protein [Pseudomonas sp. 1928-m]|uniref:PIN domain-containing protein n=1 Tax=Pseudomonas sp. 1928-m TaxID=3033804 RepID=UPI0023E03B7E|nr:PIN domain-containing protein [Pseudomonas sp. 1928-m]MDF3196349.1 PIN domain-containing protein [Pseudomonas sp. 1928-m]
MELKSRIVFLDTNIYEGKNFQFSTHALKAFKQLVEEDEIHLLITDPTIGEVRAHIKEKAESAVREIKKIKKNAMILRNTPNLPAHGIFSDINTSEIEGVLNKNFDEFITGENVEHVSIETVSATQVFDRYFNLKPPFAIGEKRKEFADAYVLLAINSLSKGRNWPVHILTNDRDMHRFSEEYPNLICSESLDELMDAVNKAKAIEPAEFAETAYSKVSDQVLGLARESLEGMDVDIVDSDGVEIDLDFVEYSELAFVSKNLLSVDSQYCVYDIAFSVRVDTLESIKDYDRSPFDHEDGRYVFVLETIASKTFRTQFSAELVIGYSDRIIDSIYIEEFNTPDDLVLSNPIEATYRQLDINGE